MLCFPGSSANHVHPPSEYPKNIMTCSSISNMLIDLFVALRWARLSFDRDRIQGLKKKKVYTFIHVLLPTHLLVWNRSSKLDNKNNNRWRAGCARIFHSPITTTNERVIFSYNLIKQLRSLDLMIS